MALSKPGFYFLAQHGPWSHHVKFESEAKALEAVQYLASNGYKGDVDYELIYEALGAQKGEAKAFRFASVSTRRVMPTTMAGNINGVSPMTGPVGPLSSLRSGSKRTAIVFFKDPKIASYIKLSYG